MKTIQDQRLYVHRLFAKVLAKVPAIEIQDDSIVVGQAITISPAEIEVKRIGGTRTVPGFHVDVAHFFPGNHSSPPDVDIIDVSDCHSFEQAALDALLLWVKNEAQIWQENEGITEMLAEEEAAMNQFKVGDTVIVTTDRLAGLRVPLGQGAKATIRESDPEADEYLIDFKDFPDADGSPDERSYHLHRADMRLAQPGE